MSRRTWKKGNLYISFGSPSITAYHDGQVIKDMSNVMYFYYDIHILQEKKTMFHQQAYDFPKVQNLHLYIDEIMNFDMSKAYLLEDYKRDGFERKIRYHQVILDDSFHFDIEYFYKIERYDYSVKQSQENEPKCWTEYVLTIGAMEKCRTYGGDNREEYGRSITIKYLTPDDLLRLKNTANAFCEEAVRLYNKFVTEHPHLFIED